MLSQPTIGGSSNASISNHQRNLSLSAAPHDPDRSELHLHMRGQHQILVGGDCRSVAVVGCGCAKCD